MAANHIETSAMTLSRVEQNDPALKELTVSNAGGFGTIFYYWPNNSADLARLGDAIGNNMNLRRLDIHNARALADMAANDGSFFEGLKRNTSIYHLYLASCDLSGGMGRDILNGFVANNTNLLSIAMYQCALENGGADILLSAVTSCPNLRNITLPSYNIDDDLLEDFVSGTIGRLFRSLVLSRNNFGRAGCEALAILLQDPNGNLTRLGLERNNRIDDNCATVLTNSLKVNRKLYHLNLSSSAITESGWDAFSQVLCNTSNVNATYLSNHTLRNLGNINLPTNLTSLLELNHGTDKKQVAIQKILRHHAHLDMEPFLEWDLKVLPLAVSWFDRAREYVQHDKSAIDAIESYLQFINLPELCP